MYKRLREVRKALGMTQPEFGERIGLSGSALSNFENGTRKITDRTVAQICKEFNVDYKWLTTGEGQMFVDTGDALDALVDAAMSDQSGLARAIFKGFAQLDVEDWRKLEAVIDKFLAGFDEDQVRAFIAQHMASGGGEDGDGGGDG